MKTFVVWSIEGDPYDAIIGVYLAYSRLDVLVQLRKEGILKEDSNLDNSYIAVDEFTPKITSLK